MNKTDTRNHLSSPAIEALQNKLLKKLRSILPEEQIISHPDELRVYESDGLAAYRRQPLLVVLPDTETEIQAILKLCLDTETPVVCRGAGTGLSGGALPHPEDILLSMTRFCRILEIDALNRRARVQPGVRKYPGY